MRAVVCFVSIALTLASAGCTSTGARGRPRGADSHLARSPAAMHACRPVDLSASIDRRGSNASAPFILVALTNSGARCTIGGYPRVAAYNASGSRLGLLVRHGTYEVPDPGPHGIVLDPGHAAMFAFGTSTASGERLALIRKLAIRIPGTAAGAINLRIPGGMGASAPPSDRFPVGITAFAAG